MKEYIRRPPDAEEYTEYASIDGYFFTSKEECLKHERNIPVFEKHFRPFYMDDRMAEYLYDCNAEAFVFKAFEGWEEVLQVGLAMDDIVWGLNHVKVGQNYIVVADQYGYWIGTIDDICKAFAEDIETLRNRVSTIEEGDEA